MDAQSAIAEVLNPHFLNLYSKKNMRSLTQAEIHDAEKIKFGVLCGLQPLSAINTKSVMVALNQYTSHFADIYETYTQWVSNISMEVDRKLTLDELKHVQACVYAEYNQGDDDG